MYSTDNTVVIVAVSDTDLAISSCIFVCSVLPAIGLQNCAIPLEFTGRTILDTRNGLVFAARIVAHVNIQVVQRASESADLIAFSLVDYSVVSDWVSESVVLPNHVVCFIGFSLAIASRRTLFLKLKRLLTNTVVEHMLLLLMLILLRHLLLVTFVVDMLQLQIVEAKDVELVGAH